MGILARFTRTKYNDEQIVYRSQVAVSEDPLIDDAVDLNIQSDHGVVTVNGTVHKQPEKDRIEGVIRGTLRDAGLKYDRIVNEIDVH